MLQQVQLRPLGCRQRTLVRAQASSHISLARLVELVEQKGGYIHPDLQLVDAAPCGVRGVVAGRALTAEELQEKGLAIVPTEAWMDGRRAAQLLVQRLGGTAEDVEALHSRFEQVQLVAAALAAEHAAGPASEWEPYCALLPAVPPVPWLMSDTELTHALADAERRASAALASTSAAGPTSVAPGSGAQALHTDGWADRVRLAREHYGALAEEMLTELGPRLGLSHKQMMWGMGQVCSRSLGTGSRAGVVPLLDLLNHSPEARPPMLQLNEQDQLVLTCTNMRGGEVAGLAAGEEVCISYGSQGAHSPLESFLKFGFVAPEAWVEAAAEAEAEA